MASAKKAAYKKPIPDMGYLKECFDYDDSCGKLVWRARPEYHFVDEVAMRKWNTRYSGTYAGRRSTQDGYWYITLKATKFLAHRLIWAWHNGISVDEEIDHRNLDRGNSNVANLRAGTHAQNSRNIPKKKNNSIGLKGVYFNFEKQKFQAQINIDGKNTYLGRFDAAEEAYEEYCKAARKYHGEYANTQ